jgi:uncharacterized membrane protein
MQPLMRSALAGIASGARSLSAVTACALTAPGRGRVDALIHRGRVPRVAVAAAALELVGDKLPMTPPRTAPPAFTARVALGAASGGLVAARAGERRTAGALVGAAAAMAWTVLAPHARAAAAARAGRDLPGAVAEDALALLLAAAATRA